MQGRGEQLRERPKFIGVDRSVLADRSDRGCDRMQRRRSHGLTKQAHANERLALRRCGVRTRCDLLLARREGRRCIVIGRAPAAQRIRCCAQSGRAREFVPFEPDYGNERKAQAMRHWQWIRARAVHGFPAGRAG